MLPTYLPPLIYQIFSDDSRRYTFVLCKELRLFWQLIYFYQYKSLNADFLEMKNYPDSNSFPYLHTSPVFMLLFYPIYNSNTITKPDGSVNCSCTVIFYFLAWSLLTFNFPVFFTVFTQSFDFCAIIWHYENIRCLNRGELLEEENACASYRFFTGHVPCWFDCIQNRCHWKRTETHDRTIKCNNLRWTYKEWDY